MLKVAFCLFNLLIITACSASYEKLKTVDSRTNNSFTKNLLEAYKEKAIYEAEEMHDWNSAKLYSEKALNALVGAEVKPQEITYWKLPKKHIFELTQSYNNLMIIYNEAKILDPYNLAIAISSLDCWAEQQEENWQTWDIKKCRDDFLNAMHEMYAKISDNEKNQDQQNLEDKIINNPESVTVVTKNEKREIMQIIYFDFDEYTLSEVSLNTLKTFLDKYQNQISNYVIVGHTDTKGTNQYNLKLSLKRAETIKTIFLQKGIEEKNINILGKGEEFLAVL
ncbi:uncharacterized protein METZ01_LOCUS380714, partial [marine metagenome]